MKRIGIILFLALFGFAYNAACQEDLKFEDWMDYEASCGEVKVVGKAEKTITVLEAGAGKEEKIIVQYYIKDKVELEGVEDVDEIIVGDMVDIEYYTAAGGKKVIDFMSVEKQEEDQERDILLEDSL
ncbi:hypothetical protein OAA99_01975 [Omnitrophica bacterium]|nr:hypothetical protein [Candidatus Omnitrophota bacterium]